MGLWDSNFKAVFPISHSRIRLLPTVSVHCKHRCRMDMWVVCTPTRPRRKCHSPSLFIRGPRHRGSTICIHIWGYLVSTVGTAMQVKQLSVLRVILCMSRQMKFEVSDHAVYLIMCMFMCVFVNVFACVYVYVRVCLRVCCGQYFQHILSYYFNYMQSTFLARIGVSAI